MDIPIIYEDDGVLAVNKPAGLMVHPDGKRSERTLTDWVREHYPALAGVGEPLRADGTVIERPGIVHRLDQETSGILILAKTQAAFAWLKDCFQSRQVVKSYNAFLYGVPTQREGSIDMPIGRSRKDFRLRSAERTARGAQREAQTFYKVLDASDTFSYVEASPKTGRTHQLRAHFKAIQHPIVCDRLYAPKRALVRRSRGEGGCALGFQRLALHARTLSLQLPSGVGVLLEAPLPDDFEHALQLMH